MTPRLGFFATKDNKHQLPLFEQRNPLFYHEKHNNSTLLRATTIVASGYRNECIRAPTTPTSTAIQGRHQDSEFGSYHNNNIFPAVVVVVRRQGQ
jgi:hypothetical protein